MGEGLSRGDKGGVCRGEGCGGGVGLPPTARWKEGLLLRPFTPHKWDQRTRGRQEWVGGQWW